MPVFVTTPFVEMKSLEVTHGNGVVKEKNNNN
jgi:hypothetical protein